MKNNRLGAALKRRKKFAGIESTQAIVLGFLLVIIIGAFLLNLPSASSSGKSIGFWNALFTSTSATCVTGLVIVNTATHWSVFGKAVIMALFQIGGLGFMTVITMAMIFSGRRITLKDRLVIQESLNQSGLTGMVRLVRNVVIGTLIIELIGAALLTLRFVLIPDMSLNRAVWYGLFHSVSAFCNAGFDILGDRGLSDFVGDPVINLTIMLLIILGGIGYAVWMDVIKAVRQCVDDRRVSFRSFFQKLNLHSKLTLEISICLILFGAVFYFFAERGNLNTLGRLPLPDVIWASLFQSVSTRTAGFSTMFQNKMEYGSQLMSVLLMFVGGSSGGTAGGVKTATFGIIIISVISLIRGKESIEVHHKSIPLYLLQKSLAIVMLNISAIVVCTMILSFTEHGSVFSYGLMDLLFESASAVSTTGMTLGLTPHLSALGRLTICICMFLGRIGPVTVVIALSAQLMKANTAIHYPEEKIMVG